MTPKEKAAKLDAIKHLINKANFKIDSYGNYKQTLNEIEYRIKLKAINIRIERKVPGNPTWYKVTSQPIVSIDMQKLVTWAAKFTSTN